MIPLGISNSSPFIALERIDRINLFQHSFQRVIVPEAVACEIGQIPQWVTVKPIADSGRLAIFPPNIHKGEAEVICLGIEDPDAVLVLDDWYARQFAKHQGYQIIGTVGLLLGAKRHGIVAAVLPILQELTAAGFRLSDSVIADAQRLAGE